MPGPAMAIWLRREARITASSANVARGRTCNPSRASGFFWEWPGGTNPDDGVLPCSFRRLQLGPPWPGGFFPLRRACVLHAASCRKAAEAKALPFGRQIRARRAATLAFVAHSSIATTCSDLKDA